MPAKAIAEILQRYAAALSALDMEGLRTLWDPTASGPFYVLDELHEPVLEWSDLEHQLERLRTRFVRAEAHVHDMQIRASNDDVALAYAVLSWTFVAVESNEPRSGHSRLTAVARSSPSGWQLIQLTESPLHVADHLGTIAASAD
jgi:hypothetical protein